MMVPSVLDVSCGERGQRFHVRAEGRRIGQLLGIPRRSNDAPCEHDTLVEHIESTVKNLGGTGLPNEKVDALAQYVASMKAPPKRAATAQQLVTRGKGIFESSEAGCSSCHVDLDDGERRALVAYLRSL